MPAEHSSVVSDSAACAIIAAMSNLAPDRTSGVSRTRLLIGGLLVCAIVLSILTAYLGLQWQQVAHQEATNLVWGLCGSTNWSLPDPMPDCPDPRRA